MGFDRSRLGDAHVGRGDAGGGGGSEGFDRVPQRQGDSAAGSAAARSANGWVLFATGVHPEAQEDDVLDHFADYGQVTNLHLNQDRRTGEVRGYALVEFAEYADAKDAKDNLDRKALLGQELCVDWAFVKRPERRR